MPDIARGPSPYVWLILDGLTPVDSGQRKKLFHGIRPITPIYAKIKNAGLPGTNPVIQGLA